MPVTVTVTIDMPGPDQRSVTLSKKIYDLAKKQAEAEAKSIAKHITELILEHTEVPVDGV